MDTEENDKKEDCEEKIPRLFTIKIVNTYGSADLDTLKDDGSVLKISSECFLNQDNQFRRSFSCQSHVFLKTIRSLLYC